MSKIIPITDAVLKTRLLAVLAAGTPMRVKPLTVKLGVSRHRIEDMLNACRSEGKTERIADGVREGKTMYLWTRAKGKRVIYSTSTLPFNPAETLDGFRAAVLRIGFAQATA